MQNAYDERNVYKSRVNLVQEVIELLDSQDADWRAILKQDYIELAKVRFHSF
jgi:hypothetical protein